MQIVVHFIKGGTFTDRARDMHNAEPRAQEWANQDGISFVEIIHEQQTLLTIQGKG